MKRAGFTLAEVTVAAFLFGVVLLVLTSALITGYRILTRASRQSQVQRNALLSVRWLQEAMRTTHPSSLVAPPRMTPAVTGVQFLTSLDATGTVKYSPYGQTLWQAWIACYREPSDRTLRTCRQPVTPVWYPDLTPPIIAVPDSRVLARQLDTLECQVLGSDGSLLNVTVVTRDEKFTSNMTTTLRVPTSGD